MKNEPVQPPKSIQYDLTDIEDVQAIAKMVSALQRSDAIWKTQQDGCNFWIVLS
jgi:hypothetical protein